LKADLESTKRNYEEQLSTLTEHLMTMNDQLQAKDKDMDGLRLQIKQGGSKSKSAGAAMASMLFSSKKTKPTDSDFPQFAK
jgi:hypothetical protein